MSPEKKIEILFEDEFLLVINKPSGIVVNRSQTSRDATVQDFLEESNKLFSVDMAVDSEFSLRHGIVHRIDKDTSGALLIAKNAQTFEYLKSQFKERHVLKEYLALVLGAVSDPKIEIDAPIKRDPRMRLRMSVHHDGRPAKTNIELIENINLTNTPATLLRVYPKTGRTHQIRVHLCAIKHPILGDRTYSTEKQMSLTKEEITRLMLHAYKITFSHPATQEKIMCEAPIPKEFLLLCPKLAKISSS